MIIKKIYLDGIIRNIQVFDNLFEYVKFYYKNINKIKIKPEDNSNFIVSKIKPIDNDFFIINQNIKINENQYTIINWGEEEINVIPDYGVNEEFWAIFVKKNNKYVSNGMIFETKEEAEMKLNEINIEVRK